MSAQPGETEPNTPYLVEQETIYEFLARHGVPEAMPTYLGRRPQGLGSYALKSEEIIAIKTGDAYSLYATPPQDEKPRYF